MTEKTDKFNEFYHDNEIKEKECVLFIKIALFQKKTNFIQGY